MTRNGDLARRLLGRPMSTGPPLEHLRIAGLPASDNYPRSPNQALRDMLDDEDAPRGDLSIPSVRTCRCGADVMRGSPADALHIREHGPEPEPAEPEEVITPWTSRCGQCDKEVAYGVTYCSKRCRRVAIRAGRAGDAAG